MSSNLFAIQVEDVNGAPVPDAVIVVKDLATIPGKVLTGIVRPGGLGLPPKMVYDLGGARQLSIELQASAQFFGQDLALKRDPDAGTYEVNARSPIWGLFTEEASGDLGVLLRLVARRVRQAPRTVAVAPTQDIAPPVVDDPAGIWLDRNRLLVGLFDGKVSRFPVIMGRSILGDPQGNDWSRFLTTAVDVDPHAPSDGNQFEWLEYGDPDPNGFRMLVAIWVVNRAGARADGRMDMHFFFCPRTAGTPGDFYGPPGIYPYKRKRIAGDIIQPYSSLGYTYLSIGSQVDSNFGIAYQAIASKKSHVVVMPLNVYGYNGPLLSRQGLHRLAKEVAAYVSDNTVNTIPPSAPSSQFSAGSVQTLNRIAVSGYSAGALDTINLFRCSSIAELADTYSKAKTDPTAQEYAKRLAALKPALWQSPAADFERKWAEFYSIDGFYGSDSYTAFPDEPAKWFAGGPDRILRVYATAGRMKSAADVVKNKLPDVFRGVTPNTVERTGDNTYKAEEWHRPDGRATLALFSEKYMTFTGVPFMPADDAHHTIPRVVFSHALSQSKLQQM